MKKYPFLSVIAVAALMMSLSSCENGKQDFPDFEGGVSVYFATQYPVRTLVIGEDEYDTSMDNAHKFKIVATMGGAYSGRDIAAQIAVDPSITNNLYFVNGSPVQAMPTNYYTLADNTIRYNGSLTGSVEVQLTDAFFADPDAVSNTYVIPLVMTSQTGADSILVGRTLVAGESPQRTNSIRWDIQPKDFVLYLVKYICKYDANYLHRGYANITAAGAQSKVVYTAATLEKTPIVSNISTRSLNSILYPVTYNINHQDVTCNLLVSFDAQGNATVSSATEGVTVSGSGSYQDKAAKKAWGDQDRDALYLDYNIDFGTSQVVAKDTLIWQSRGVKVEEFAPTYKQN
ncbi:MAG: DUF5627 domain-containing protein [Prevotella sp.]|nr:DUF5627 domain-containing protein [Prevotella sp.]MDD4533801.1 DUF5627 domain-containing protein [Prevotella sp.]MDT3386593.1 DUF5627 domain-containing protein [Bacteroidota bacterium]